MTKNIMKNWLAILLGLLFVAIMAWNYIAKIPFINNLETQINNSVYDLLLRANIHKIPPIKNNSVAVVAIDDASISEIGRWPWGRKKVTELTYKLHQMGATVIAYDILFSEPENNIITETLTEISQSKQQIPETITNTMEQLKPNFDYDQKFASELQQGDQVLGFVLNPLEATSVGALPEPLLTLNPQQQQDLKITNMLSYMGNIANLQTAAKNGGFLNAIPDSDGTLRNAALFLRLNDKIYPSLSLEATRVFLLSDKVNLVTATESNHLKLQGIELDNLLIPTNEQGEILIPFRGASYTFPFFSASDILLDRVDTSDISGKIIFIGATATGLGDLKPSAIANNYPGVEVHASIASGIIDHYFPARLSWGGLLELILVLTLGSLSAFIFPFLTAPWLGLIGVSSILIWLFVTTWCWVHYAILLSILFPTITIFLLAFSNMIHSYLVSSNQRKEIKSMFGQYVPQQHVDSIIKSSGEGLLDGENKELTVLFSDICGFTTMSEKMTAPQLKAQLNEYLTAMTRVIFDYGGTIDKYVGDMIMAFWNAPILEADHAKKAVLSGLKMQSELRELNQVFIKNNRPDIRIGVGINTGMMNVGDMGSKYRRAYTAIGDAVNLASRLEGMCRQYFVDIIVGEDTYEQTKDDFTYMHLDRVKVKGKNQGVNIYLPLEESSQTTSEELAEVTNHHIALNAYFKQEWVQAESLFNEMIANYPNRLLYPVYIERIEYFKANPPPHDWDGTFVHKSK